MQGHSDQVTQQKQLNVLAAIEQDQLCLEINDGSTFKGKIKQTPYFDINELKNIFQKAEFQVLSKTTSKMIIKLAGLKVQLQSQETRKLQQLKKTIQDQATLLRRQQAEIKKQQTELKKQQTESKRLEVELKKQQAELKSKSAWVQQNLNSVDNFDMNFIYTLITTSGNLTSVSVTPAIIYFIYAGSNYTTQSKTRRVNSTGWAVTRLLKCKV